MNKPTQSIIRISLLLVMIILGLIIVFPQSLELKDFLIKDSKNSIKEYGYSVDRKVDSLKQALPSFDNISPSRSDVKKYLLKINNVESVYCIGDIPKIHYSNKLRKKGRKIKPFIIEYQAIINKGSFKKLKIGFLKVSPKLRSERYGNWLLPSYWLWPDDRDVFDSWQYQEYIYPYRNQSPKEMAVNNKLSISLLDKIRIKKCVNNK